MKEIDTLNNIWTHNDFKRSKSKFIHKECFYWYFFLWFSERDEHNNNIDDYIIKVKCIVKWVYTWHSNNFCITVEWEKFWLPYRRKYVESLYIFKDRELCKKHWQWLFDRSYKEYIKDSIKKSTKYAQENIKSSNETIKKNRERMILFALNN